MTMSLEFKASIVVFRLLFIFILLGIAQKTGISFLASLPSRFFDDLLAEPDSSSVYDPPQRDVVKPTTHDQRPTTNKPPQGVVIEKILRHNGLWQPLTPRPPPGDSWVHDPHDAADDDPREITFGDMDTFWATF